MSEFDRSSATRTHTNRVSETSIVDTFHENIQKAIEHADSALLFAEVMSAQDAATGIDAFEKLASIARKGLTRCQVAAAQTQAQAIAAAEEAQALEDAKTPIKHAFDDYELTPLPRAFTIEESAEYLSVAESSVYYLLEEGELETVFDGDVRIEQTELDAFIERRNAPEVEAVRSELHGLTDTSRVRFEEIVDNLFNVDAGLAQSSEVLTGPDSTEELKRSSLSMILKEKMKKKKI